MTTRIFVMKNVTCGKSYTEKRRRGFVKTDWERLIQKHPYSFLFLSCVTGPILILAAVGAVSFAAVLLVALITGGLL